MDGLRLALIVVGIVVVVAVYFWTVRRQRAERDAGEFDRFDAWSDDGADPLVDADPLLDADEMTQPNPRRRAARDEAPDPDDRTQVNPRLGEPAGDDADPDDRTRIDPRVGADGGPELVDADEMTQPNPRRRAAPAPREHAPRPEPQGGRRPASAGVDREAAAAPDARPPAARGAATAGAPGRSSDARDDGAARREPPPSAAGADAGAKAGGGGKPRPGARDALGGLDALAESLSAQDGARNEPRLGSLDEVSAAPDGRRAPPPAGRSGDARTARGPGTSGAARETPARPAGAGGRKAPAATHGYPEPAPPEPDLVVVLNVMAPEGRQFEGPALRDALESAGLRSGEMQLYHYRAEAQPADAPPVFSALNAVKPGTLDPDEFDGMHTPGVALVLRLPGLERPSEAFELMHSTAQSIAAELGGRICDHSRSTLTKQALNHLRETIAEHVRRKRVGG